MNLSIHQLSPIRPAQCRSDTEYLVFLIARYVSFICILLFGPVLGPVFIFIGLNMWNPHITAIPNMRRCMWDDMDTFCSVSREKISMNLSIHQLNPTRPAQCRSDTEPLVLLRARYVPFIRILLFGPVLGPVFIFIGLNMWNPHIVATPAMRRSRKTTQTQTQIQTQRTFVYFHDDQCHST